jgi:hypothetical protein
MSKINKKNLIIGILAIGVIVGIIFWSMKKDQASIPPLETPPVTNTMPTPPVVKNNQPIELCFARFGTPNTQGLADKYTLRMILNGNNATGELNLLPAEKDRKTGEFKGTVTDVDDMSMSRTMNLLWYTVAEGMNAQEELKIVFGEGTASIGFGEMVLRGNGSYGYKDLSKVDFSLDLTDVACSDLAERANVENYVRDNIEELSPVKAVLGGTWYVTFVIIDPSKNTGTVSYEDGHIAEKKNFSYVVDSKQQVTSLKIN